MSNISWLKKQKLILKNKKKEPLNIAVGMHVGIVSLDILSHRVKSSLSQMAYSG